MTPLGLLTGEILMHLEAYGATTVRKLIQALEAPISLVTMGVGALIRAGLVRGSQHGTEVLVEVRCEPYGYSGRSVYDERH